MVGDILQPTHLLFVLVIALLVLGPKRLPEVGRSLGRGLRDFRTAISGEDDDHEERDNFSSHPSVESAHESSESTDSEPAEGAVAEPVSAESTSSDESVAAEPPAAPVS